MRPAVFIDRDGTLIAHVHHLTSVEGVRILPGVADALSRLRAAGFALVVVTNQSVVGRGMLTPDGLDRIHAEMLRQIRVAGGPGLDAIYACFHVPRKSDPTVIDHVDRKPGPGLILRGARDLDLDISRSWMIGDAISDVLAARNAGCHGAILLRTDHDLDSMSATRTDDLVVDDIAAAADRILSAGVPILLHSGRAGGSS